LGAELTERLRYGKGDPTALSSLAFRNFHGLSSNIHALVTVIRRCRSRQSAEMGSEAPTRSHAP